MSGGGNPSSGSGGGSSGASSSGGGSSSGGIIGTGSSGGGGGGSDGGVGVIDSTPPCDTGLAIDDPNAASFAKAIGICTMASQAGYGLVSASYSKAFGSTAAPHDGQWGLLPKFGSVIVPREGSSLGVLSSGYAREYDDPQGNLMNAPSTTAWACPGSTQCVPWWTSSGPEGAQSDFINSSPDGPLQGFNYPTAVAPPGFPQAAQGCAQSKLVNDMIDLKLVLKAPATATAFSFDLDFYSSEWPNTVCSEYNDAFVAYLTSSGLTGNISFDPNKNPIAVNANFFNRCTPGAPVGCAPLYQGPAPQTGTSTCSAGTSELQGTGFSNLAMTWCETSADIVATEGGATGWLTTLAPISAGEQFTLELMIWDAGDGLADSSILLDHFQWLGGTPVTVPVTQPIQ
jgi:hypothetical protein